MVIYPRRSNLSPDEQELKHVMQAVLIKIGVLKTDSEAEWQDYATRKALRGFPELMERLTQKMKSVKPTPTDAPAKKRKARPKKKH